MERSEKTIKETLVGSRPRVMTRQISERKTAPENTAQCSFEAEVRTRYGVPEWMEDFFGINSQGNLVYKGLNALTGSAGRKLRHSFGIFAMNTVYTRPSSSVSREPSDHASSLYTTLSAMPCGLTHIMLDFATCTL